MPTLAELTSVMPRQRDLPACQARFSSSTSRIDRAVFVDANNGRKPWLRATSAGRARPRRRACRCSGARSSRPAACGRRNWAKAGRSCPDPCAQWRISDGRSGQAPAAARRLVQRRGVLDVGCRRPTGDRGRAPWGRRQLAGLADHRFARAEHQPAVLGHRDGEPLERQRLLLGAEVEQDVAAQDDVEVARMRRRLRADCGPGSGPACAAPRRRASRPRIPRTSGSSG